MPFICLIYCCSDFTQTSVFERKFVFNKVHRRRTGIALKFIGVRHVNTTARQTRGFADLHEAMHSHWYHGCGAGQLNSEKAYFDSGIFFDIESYSSIGTTTRTNNIISRNE